MWVSTNIALSGGDHRWSMMINEKNITYYIKLHVSHRWATSWDLNKYGIQQMASMRFLLVGMWLEAVCGCLAVSELRSIFIYIYCVRSTSLAIFPSLLFSANSQQLINICTTSTSLYQPHMYATPTSVHTIERSLAHHFSSITHLLSIFVWQSFDCVWRHTQTIVSPSPANRNRFAAVPGAALPVHMYMYAEKLTCRVAWFGWEVAWISVASSTLAYSTQLGYSGKNSQNWGTSLIDQSTKRSAKIVFLEPGAISFSLSFSSHPLSTVVEIWTDLSINYSLRKQVSCISKRCRPVWWITAPTERTPSVPRWVMGPNLIFPT